MKELVELIARELVDQPEKVRVKEIEGHQATVLELRVADGDLGKVIGKQGRTARAIRTILNASGIKLKKRFVLEILE
jgi:uncharacterized protein